MNDIRMYVEGLFEGKVLTAELIELKEEIYGNLVARYDDYIAQGMDAAAALAKTKASLTSVDDVLAAGEDEAQPEAGETSAAAPATGTAAAASGEACAPAPAPTAETTTASAAAPRAKRKKWPIVVGVVCALVVVVLVGLALDGAFAGDESDATLAASSQAATDSADSTDDATDADDATDTSTAAEDDISLDWWSYATNVSYADTAYSMSYLTAYANMTLDEATFTSLLSTLPLAAYLDSVSVDEQAGTLTVAYANVPDDDDAAGALADDELDYSLAYNVVALFSVAPDLNIITVTVHEAGDAAGDVDTYQFVRSAVEATLSSYTYGEISELDAAWVVDQDIWDAVCFTVLTEDVYDDIIEAAEL